MEILIHDTIKLCEIQHEFNKHFPNLKIEFFSIDPKEKEVFSKEHLIKDTTKSFAEVRHIHWTGHISINGHQKVETIEKHFRDQYGIYAQIFRKSGNVWLETTTNDNLTLSELNRMAAEMNKTVEEEDTEDYHEQL